MANSKKGNDKHIDALYKAVTRYVESRGGKLVVIGGIAVQHWPGDSTAVFHISVKCCGLEPKIGGDHER